ncbi:S8 family serine peptidase [Ideonella sp.]|uniref:S8 family serine peptidase n=1 Tax=Ideonella sp. TaxID=1929293 RepID=UPI002B460B54|nr:S8 family serine peptidase [Ideonella sp.]HJV72222.1 S8 family serine peptidase [Ideonella sp.]
MKDFARRLLLAFALCAGAAGARGGEPGAEPVSGLIVRLHDAPPHAGGRAHALAAAPASPASPAERAERALHARRWAVLLADTGLGRLPGIRLEPVGRASLRLHPARPWSAAEAARWQARLAQRPEVAWAVPDRRESLQQQAGGTAPLPDDPLFPGADGQWWLQPVSGSNANAPEARLRGVPGLRDAWAVGTGRADTVIAVLDSGWTAHPDLDPARLLPGYDLVSDWDDALQRGDANDGDGRDADARDPGDWVSAADRRGDPGRYGACDETDSTWHGTAVLGLIAAHSGNALGVAGIDWAARLLPVRVAGKCGATLHDIVDGLRWAAGLPVCRRSTDTLDPDAGCAEWAPVNPHPAQIINLSYGGVADCNAEYQDAIDELWARGVIVVAAGGNTHAAPTRPANCEHVVGVAALNRDGFKTHYSAFGAALRIATVGGDDAGGHWGGLLADSGLVGLANFGSQGPGVAGYAAHFGTSYAAPVVSGTLGLMRALNPALTSQQLIDGLAASARPHVQSALLAACSSTSPGRCACTASTCGAGVLDAPQALAYAQALARGERYLRPNWPIVQIDTPELRAAVALGPDRESAAGQPLAEQGAGGGALSAVAIAALLMASIALSIRSRRLASASPRPGR